MRTLWMSTLALATALSACGDEDHESAAPDFGPPPASPRALEQRSPDGLQAIGQGAIQGETAVQLRARVEADPRAGGLRLHVELGRPGIPFTGMPTASAGVASSGSVLGVVIRDLADGEYVWTAWAEDERGRISLPASFPAGPGAAFTVDRSLPFALRQSRILGGNPIQVGGQTEEIAVLLSARVRSLRGNMARAHYEVKPCSTPFDGESLVSGFPVPNGESSDATAFLSAPGPFHWRVRTEDADGTLSGWVAFGGNDDVPEAAPDFVRLAPSGTLLSLALPTNLEQVRADRVSLLPLGGTTFEHCLYLRGRSAYASLRSYALQIQATSIFQTFDGARILTGPFKSAGSLLEVPVRISEIGGSAGGKTYFHWRARLIGSSGATSEGFSFGGNDERSTDFASDASFNSAPAVPTSLRQFQLDGSTGVRANGALSGPGLIADAIVVDPDPNAAVTLEVEVKPTGQPFVNLPSAMGRMGRSGDLIRVVVPGLNEGAAYHWQVRAVDAAGGLSAWIEYSGDTASLVSGNGSGGGGGGGSLCSGSVASAPSPLVLATLAVLALLAGRRR